MVMMVINMSTSGPQGDDDDDDDVRRRLVDDDDDDDAYLNLRTIDLLCSWIILLVLVQHNLHVDVVRVVRLNIGIVILDSSSSSSSSSSNNTP